MDGERALERLRDAVAKGTPAALDAWAATGRDGLAILRAVLVDDRDLGVETTSMRDVFDNLAEATARIAAADPAAFLEVFDDAAVEPSRFILTGLGYVDDPRATRRLIVATRSTDSWTRMDATIGLGRHHSSLAVAALVSMLGDAEYLVRYHALEGLASVGDPSALAALRGYEPEADFERELADAATTAIQARATSAPPISPGTP